MGIMNVQANQSDGRESVMCTGVRFSDDEGNTYFGRNLDWSFSYGETILVTPRGYHYDTVFGAGGKAKPNAVIGVGVSWPIGRCISTAPMNMVWPSPA